MERRRRELGVLQRQQEYDSEEEVRDEIRGYIVEEKENMDN